MLEPKSVEDRVDELAEELAHRCRSGEEPSVEEYALRYPQWAEQIRAVLPAVVLMEQLKPCRDEVKPAAPGLPVPERPIDRVGEYRILREIGRGGMGVVYEAEQETLGRRVAIKVLPAHLLADDKLRARFHREAQAAARLHHTNIVPVFDVGEREGLCFYVMQRIEGLGLDRLIRQATDCRKEKDAKAAPPRTEIAPPALPTLRPAGADTDGPAGPGRGPAFPLHFAEGVTSVPRDLCRATAQVGLQVAEALAYAHGQGVLHRDIKPSNLLLDDRGAVWVTDFGVAKLVEEANLTQSGDLVGTLRYMPPERFAGLSDARGDVYSLGLTLYELLTLEPAFPDTSPQHLIQLITHEAPVRPRRRNAAIPADLETIVLKSLARDPAHRYQTASDLADDLRCFLDDRPIRARRITVPERAWRWCRRNPALAAAIAASLLLMVAVTVVSLVAWARTAAAGRETAQANEEMEKALAAEKAQREEAERTATLALGALLRTYDRLAPARLVVTPQPPDEDGIEMPTQPVALAPEAVPLLEDLLDTYEEIARSAGEFPRLHAHAAEANHRIGDIAQRLGRYQTAVAAYRAAIGLYTGLAGGPGGDDVRIKLARACNELGRILQSLQQPQEAQQMHTRAMKVLGESPALARRPECRYELARSYYALGLRDKFLTPGPLGPGRPPPPPGAAKHWPPGFERGLLEGKAHPTQRAADLLEKLVEDYPKVPEYRHLLACCCRDMPSSGAANREEAVKRLRKLVEDFPWVPDYRFDLCEALARPSPPSRPGPPPRPAEKAPDPKAREQLEEAIPLSAKLMAQYPNVPEYTAAHARYLDRLGMVLFREAEREEAEKRHHRAAELLAEAEKRHRKAVQLQTRLAEQHRDVLAYRCWQSLMERSLGRVLRDRGRLEEGVALIEGAISRVEPLVVHDARLGGLRPFLDMAYRDLAVALTRSGDPQRAAAALARAEEYGRGRHGPPPPPEPGLGPQEDR